MKKRHQASIPPQGSAPHQAIEGLVLRPQQQAYKEYAVVSECLVDFTRNCGLSIVVLLLLNTWPFNIR